MRRPQITVQRLMLAVAVVGISLGVLVVRQRRFNQLAVRYRAEFEKFPSITPYEHFGSWSEEDNLRYEWLYTMVVKYEYASRHSWVLVEADPPYPNR